MDFSTSQKLCEDTFGKSKMSKYGQFYTLLQTQYFNFDDIFQFFQEWNFLKIKIQSLVNYQNAHFAIHTL